MFEFENRVAIKVCGVGNTSDALACAEMGVEMVGLNFSPQSARCISPGLAAEIIAAVRPQFRAINFVGVFVNQQIELVQKITRDLALDGVQLHGEEAPEYVHKLEASFVIKALRVGSGSAVSAMPDYQCAAILLDSWSATAPGGTGETFPWQVAAALRPLVGRLILAGGLTSENVGEAIQTVRPFAVDVCSGVEATPGRKDRVRISHFVEAVRTDAGVRTSR